MSQRRVFYSKMNLERSLKTIGSHSLWTVVVVVVVIVLHRSLLFCILAIRGHYNIHIRCDNAKNVLKISERGDNTTHIMKVMTNKNQTKRNKNKWNKINTQYVQMSSGTVALYFISLWFRAHLFGCSFMRSIDRWVWVSVWSGQLLLVKGRSEIFYSIQSKITHIRFHIDTYFSSLQPVDFGL